MSKRTKSQIRGDIARGQVELIFAESAWATDRVGSDYGEDLVVQPVRGGGEHVPRMVDTFRILVQVKGKSGLHRDREWQISVRRDHVARWIRLSEPFVFVVWSLDHDFARYCFPSTQFRVDQVRAGEDGHLQLALRPDGLLNAEALNRLAWKARQDILAKDVLAYKNEIQELQQAVKELEYRPFGRNLGPQRPDPFAMERARKQAELDDLKAAYDQLLGEFLESLEIFENGVLLERHLRDWPEYYRYMVEDWEYEYEEAESYLFGTGLIHEASELWGGGLNPILKNALGLRIMSELPDPCDRPG